MDFRFTPQEEALRQEARTFVRREWRPSDRDAHSLVVSSYDVDDAEEQERIHEFAKKVAKKGWWTMHWPKEYGGPARH